MECNELQFSRPTSCSKDCLLVKTGLMETPQFIIELSHRTHAAYNVEMYL